MMYRSLEFFGYLSRLVVSSAGLIVYIVVKIHCIVHTKQNPVYFERGFSVFIHFYSHCYTYDCVIRFTVCVCGELDLLTINLTSNMSLLTSPQLVKKVVVSFFPIFSLSFLLKEFRNMK